MAQCETSILDPSPSPLPARLVHGDLVPYPFVREADVMWSKRIWRVLDLREKLNQPLYYPLIPNADRKSMWDAIYCAIKTHEIMIYQASPFDNDNSFQVQMTRTEADSALLKFITITDSNGGSSMQSEHLESSDIVKYMLKEDWFFDKQRSVMDVRILGICPFKKVYDQNGGEVPGGYSMMFWIYYPSIRPIFAHTQVFNPHNDFECRSLDEIFMKRMFSSYIIQESNVFNRAIADYATNPMDALMEGEAIKNKIFTLENDMWQY